MGDVRRRQSNESEQRQAVIVEALSWQGTPHHNGAKLKGVGVDCGQLPIAVYHACGLIPDLKTEPYPPDFHLHRDREWYLGLVSAHAREIEGNPGPGDFALFRFGRSYSHGAIVIEWPTIIHAYTGHGVVQARADQGDLVGRPVKFFTLWP